MTADEKSTITQQIVDAEDRIERFDAIQLAIDKLQRVKDGTLYKVNLIAETNDAVAVTDEDIVAKAVVVLERLIAEKLAEQAAV